MTWPDSGAAVEPLDKTSDLQTNAIRERPRPLAVAISLIALGNTTPIMQPLLVGQAVDRLSVSLRLAGMGATAEMAAFALAAVITAAHVRSTRVPHIALVALGIFSLADLTTALAHSRSLFYMARIAAGLAAGTLISLGTAEIARARQPERAFGAALAAVTAMATFVFMVAPRLGAFGGATSVFVLFAFFAVLVALVVKRSGPPFVVRQKTSSIQLHFDGRWTTLIIVGFLLYLGHGAIWTYEERIGVAIGLAPARIGVALSLASIAGLAGALAATAQGLRFGRSIPLAISLSLSIAAALSIVLWRDDTGYIGSACMIAVSWFYGVPYLNGLAAANDSSGRLAAFQTAAMNIGLASGPFIAALVLRGKGFVQIGATAVVAYSACVILLLFFATLTTSKLGGRL